MRLGVVNVNNPVPILVEDARVEQLVLSLRTIPRGVRAAQVVVRKFPLRVVVSPTQPRVRRSGVAVPPILLGVFAVVALRTRQSEHPLLEVRVTAVPQCEAHTQVLPEGGDTRHAVFVPPIGARHRVVVREVVPGITVSGIVLAHRSPRSERYGPHWYHGPASSGPCNNRPGLVIRSRSLIARSCHPRMTRG